MLVYRPLMVHENPGRIAQRESVPFTRERSKVRSLVRPPKTSCSNLSTRSGGSIAQNVTQTFGAGREKSVDFVHVLFKESPARDSVTLGRDCQKSKLLSSAT